MILDKENEWEFIATEEWSELDNIQRMDLFTSLVKEALDEIEELEKKGLWGHE